MIKEETKKKQEDKVVSVKTQLLKGYRRWFPGISGLKHSGGFFLLAFWLVVVVVVVVVVTNPYPVAAQRTPPPGPGSSSPTPPSTAGQSTTGSITGRISNGTTGVATPSQAQVKLERITQGSEKTEESQIAADVNGNFVFEKLLTGDSYTYYVSTLYAEVTYYFQTPIKLTATQPSQKVELKVYETGNDPSQVAIAGTSLVVPQVDASSGLINVLEMYSIQNKSDRTFTGQNKSPQTGISLASSPSPSQPNSTLHFFLPTGASGISPAAGLSPGDIVETSDGIEITTPVLPGESQIVFSYQLAYQGETFNYNKRLAYDTPSLRFFTPVDGPKATSNQLVTGQPVQMGQEQLATLSGQNLKAGTQLRISLSGLPLPPNQGTVAIRDTVLRVIIGVLGVAGVGFLIVYSRRKTPAAASLNKATSETGLHQELNPEARSLSHNGDNKGETPERERRRLIYQLAKLDSNFAKGELSQDEVSYRERRTQLMSELLELWPDTTASAAKAASLSVQEGEASAEDERKVTG